MIENIKTSNVTIKKYLVGTLCTYFLTVCQPINLVFSNYFWWISELVWNDIIMNNLFLVCLTTKSLVSVLGEGVFHSHFINIWYCYTILATKEYFQNRSWCGNQIPSGNDRSMVLFFRGVVYQEPEKTLISDCSNIFFSIKGSIFCTNMILLLIWNIFLF